MDETRDERCSLRGENAVAPARPVLFLTQAWIYHWDADAHEWIQHQTVELGPSITQVEMSGSGNRLILFEKDYSFRVQGIAQM